MNCPRSPRVTVRPTALMQAILLLLLAGAGGCAHLHHDHPCDDICCDTADSPDLSLALCGQMLRHSRVRIVAAPGDAIPPDVLQALCQELATALSAHGVARVAVEPIVPASCEAEGAAWPPSTTAPSPDEEVEIVVSVRDFRPYQPMRIALDVQVIDPTSGALFGRVTEVYFGPVDQQPPGPLSQWRARRRLKFQADPHTDWGIRANSPRWFLGDVARRVSCRLLWTASG